MVKKGGDVNKPRGKMSAYAFFLQTYREELKQKNPNESVNFAEFSKRCAEKWKVRNHFGSLGILLNRVFPCRTWTSSRRSGTTTWRWTTRNAILWRCPLTSHLLESEEENASGERRTLMHRNELCKSISPEFHKIPPFHLLMMSRKTVFTSRLHHDRFILPLTIIRVLKN